jgi:FkbM family methyltransferase
MKFWRKLKRKLRSRSKPKLDPNRVPYDDALRFFKAQSKIYKKLVSAVEPFVDPEGTFLDVGANIGYFSLCLMDKVKFRGEALLFEPVPHLATLCRRTFKDKPYRVQIMEYALSDDNGSREIFIAADGNIGWNTFVAGKISKRMKSIQVQERRFDDLEITTAPSFIKVDVEGAEFRVFRGMLGSLGAWDRLPVIVCEIGWGHSHPNWQEELEVFGELQELGYRIYDLNRKQVDITKLEVTTDVLLLPE